MSSPSSYCLRLCWTAY